MILIAEKKRKLFLKFLDLDKTFYNVIRVKKFLIPKGNNKNFNSNFSLVVDLEGHSSPFYLGYILFYTFIGIESQNKNETYLISCKTKMKYDTKLPKNYNINCFFHVDDYDETMKLNTTYDKIYLYPYSTHYNDYYFYEVIIPQKILGISLDDDKIDNIKTDNDINNDDIIYNDSDSNESKNDDEIIMFLSTCFLALTKRTMFMIILKFICLL